MDFDENLLKNVLDEIERLNNQLKDLETYKDDFTPEEIEETKKETLEKLIETTKLLEKMKSGNVTTVTAVEKAKKQLKQAIAENYHVKDLVNSYLSNETEFLREKLQSTIRLYALKKISEPEFNSQVVQILEMISKNNKLNDEEQKMYDNLKKKNLNSLQEDKGFDKSKIEKNISGK
jgi:hypothetical protein